MLAVGHLFFVAVCAVRPASSHGAKEKVPGGVNQRVNDGRSEDGAGLAPRPTVEESRNGGQECVAPVGEVAVRDVRETE